MNFKQTLWISHSALSAYSRCPHLYYFEYIYRNPKTGNRIQIVNPYLSLGSAVHETIEGLANVSIKKRKQISLKERFENIFEGYRGKKGGFLLKSQENDFYGRGVKMMERVEKSNFLEKPSTMLEKNFPVVDLFSGEAKLVGSLDWIEVLPGGGAHIIDFKTGNNREGNGSLQLPIYAILAKENLSIEVEKVSYWYLQHDDNPVSQEIGDLNSSLEAIKEKTSAIKRSIANNYFPCKYNGKCFSCGDYEKIFGGEAEMIGSDKERKKDLFFVFKEEDVAKKVIEDNFLNADEKEMFKDRIAGNTNETKKGSGDPVEEGTEKVQEIKAKLKKNLSKGELKAVVKLLNNNGKKSES